MSEFRVTYELGLGAFSIWNPPFHGESGLATLLEGSTCTQKFKTDEYLLVPTNRFNVKFTGDEGKGFDIKELENSDCNLESEAEKWSSLAKGELEEGKSVESLAKKLEELAQTEVEKADRLTILVALLREGSCETVSTKKHLLTVKTSSGLVVEQIDFSMWRRAAKQGKRLCLRSVSLEGTIPEGLIAQLMAQLKAQYGSRLLFGGFPTLLAAALKLDAPEASATQQLRFFELEEAPAVSSFSDRSLTCVDCSSSFAFTAEQQHYHATKGWENEPLRCGPCQQTKKEKAQFFSSRHGGFSKKKTGGGGGEGKGKGGVCFKFSKEGKCEHGESCRFSHGQSSAGGGVGEETGN